MSVYDNLEFKHFASIIAIAEEGTFTAAALRIPLAQSALSRQIRELEDALGIKIFEREYDGSTLTPAGESLLRFGRELLQTRVEIVSAVQAIHQAAMQPFRLGFTPFIEHDVIATVCDAYRELFPKGHICPENGDTDVVIGRLNAGELDAVLVTLPLVPDGYCIQPIMHEPLVVCIRKDDPLAQLDELPPDALNGRLAIFSDPPPPSEGTRAAFGDAGRARNKTAQFRSHVQHGARSMDGPRAHLYCAHPSGRTTTRDANNEAHSGSQLDY